MADHTLVLVTGADGMGRLVTERLCAQSVPVRVLIRREDDRAAEVRAWGAEVVTGDLTRPETMAAS
ncbi:NAD(P)H-binding protein [Streptomyces sp. NPDC005303]|uniref:NAD(P)H-binding protein n=1 Tax=Streptomyces sp. NPDC005303 TaxID=3155713 RepID=UPI0033B45385